VFDFDKNEHRTSKAGDKFKEPLSRHRAGVTFSTSTAARRPTISWIRTSFETLTLLGADRDDRLLLVDNVMIDFRIYNVNPIGLSVSSDVALTVDFHRPAVRGDNCQRRRTSRHARNRPSRSAFPRCSSRKAEGQGHTETREFAGRGDAAPVAIRSRKSILNAVPALR